MLQDTITANANFIRTWYDEIWNKKNESAIDDLFDAHGIAHGLYDDNGNEISGPQAFKDFFKKFISSFPDLHVDVEDIICEGDKAVAQCLVTLRHTGKDFMISPGNTLKAVRDPKPIVFTGVSIARIRDGKLIEGWNNFDFLSMYIQLGLVKL